MPLQPSNLRDALASIADPDSGKDIVSAGMVKDIQTEGIFYLSSGNHGII